MEYVARRHDGAVVRLERTGELDPEPEGHGEAVTAGAGARGTELPQNATGKVLEPASRARAALRLEGMKRKIR